MAVGRWKPDPVDLFIGMIFGSALTGMYILIFFLLIGHWE